MNSKNRIAKLEAANPPNRCPHEHVIGRFIKPDGSDSTAGEVPEKSECGREIITREIQFVPYEGMKQNET
jgi:hypothetical protein